MRLPEADYSEDTLVEQPSIELFEELGWEAANCFYEQFGPGGTLGRETSAEVVLVSRLRPALERLNPSLSSDTIQVAVEELTRDRSILHPVEANREIYRLLRDGVRVKVSGEGGEETVEVVRVIDWDKPEKNDFFLASQFWISGEIYKRRADLLGFVNGLPLVFIELKTSHERLERAYKDNLRDYKNTIPQVFWYNAFIILSNGSESRIGTISSEWEHFSEWKKITSEGEEGIVSLETMIRGTCEKNRLFDLTENFLLYSQERGGLVKMIAKNHQFLGVNSALETVRQIEENQGRLGVFWHTQGSGKSYSMVFLSQKIFRKLPGNWTFVIVTDRKELDEQIYKNFANAGVVTEEEVQAESGKHLQHLLREDHRYVFTLIHKFQTEDGGTYPKLSDRSDIIVIVDEAHRTQYDTLAQNMHYALPKAAFIAFTGTPLIVGEEKTKEVFGDYVSIYDFRQSIEDQATVPLYYENRIPELQLTNEQLNDELYDVIENAVLDEEQEEKLERELRREYHLITREDRLGRIAEDIVEHLMGRGHMGKAMVVSIDKPTAVRMYNKVQKYWKAYLERLKAELAKASKEEQEAIQSRIRFMEETDMAVVVSQAQNEAEKFQKKGLDITPHRKRMVKEDLDEKFKDPKDPFRLVFLCAMWMTGFDVPSCSTIYLDKPMKNHTLMQTIARANRVFGDKVNGLIVDYVGIFRNLQKALAIYGSASGGGIQEGDTPVKDKSALVEVLRMEIQEADEYCTQIGVDTKPILAARKFDRVKLLGEAVDAILVNDQTRKSFLSLAGAVTRTFKAILPDPLANEFQPICTLFGVLIRKILSNSPEVDISSVMGAIEELLDRSIAAEGYVIRGDEDHIVDLGQIDFESLRRRFVDKRKHIEAERLKNSIKAKLAEMVRLNRSRTDYLKKFQEMIDAYNAGAHNVEFFFDQLVKFARALQDEEKRAIAENLSESELAIFDILIKPEMKLTKKEGEQVKKVARELLQTLEKEKLVLDWRKRQQTRAAVRLAIEETLDRLPDSFTPEIFGTKCELVYQHVYDSYFGRGQSVYALA